MATADRIVLYDGVCGLCDKTVRRLIRLDRDKKLLFAPLQGETAAELRAEHPEIPTDLDTVVFVEAGRVYRRSRAFVRIARHLPYPARIASWLWVIPWPLTDLFYRLIARVRYRVWGKRDQCEIPTGEERSRFLA